MNESIRPISCNMPELANKSAGFSVAHYVLRMTFHACHINDDVRRAHATSFVRILDKAVIEYNSARSMLKLAVDKGRGTYELLRVTAHLETCINSVKRCLRHFACLHDLQLLDPSEQRLLRKRIDRISEELTDARDAIEHMDERISPTTDWVGAPIALLVSREGDRATIGDAFIRFDDLARLICALCECGDALAGYSEPRPDQT